MQRDGAGSEFSTNSTLFTLLCFTPGEETRQYKNRRPTTGREEPYYVRSTTRPSAFPRSSELGGADGKED